MSDKKKVPLWLWVVVVIFVIFFIAIFILSLGNVKPGNQITPKEFKDNREQVQRRHDKLKKLIEKKEALNQRLSKIFRIIYFAVRLVFIGIWIAYLYTCVLFNHVNNLEDALNYSEAAILVWIALNFLTFGNLSNLNAFIDLIKMRIQNWVWGKYVQLDEKIECNKKEVALLEEKINNHK